MQNFFFLQKKPAYFVHILAFMLVAFMRRPSPAPSHIPLFTPRRYLGEPLCFLGLGHKGGCPLGAEPGAPSPYPSAAPIRPRVRYTRVMCLPIYPLITRPRKMPPRPRGLNASVAYSIIFVAYLRQFFIFSCIYQKKIVILQRKIVMET